MPNITAAEKATLDPKERARRKKLANEVRRSAQHDGAICLKLNTDRYCAENGDSARGKRGVHSC